MPKNVIFKSKELLVYRVGKEVRALHRTCKMKYRWRLRVNSPKRCPGCQKKLPHVPRRRR